MKAFKYFLSAVLIVGTMWSCEDEDYDNIDLVSSTVAPTNVKALFNVTQDNSGLVTITPNGEGAITFDIYFGDNTVEPVKVKQGESITHTYNEGTYDVKLIASGITGLKTEVTQQLVVSFKAPENLVVIIENDGAISKTLNVTATADNAISFEVYFGEDENETPKTANIGETISYTYQEAGVYTVKVVVVGAAIETAEYTEEIEVTAILQPLTAAPTPPNRNAVDVISVYSEAYQSITSNEWNPGWGQSTVLTEIEIDGNKTLRYDALNYTGIVLDYDNPTDLSAMTHVHFDYWTNDATSLGLKLVNTSQADGPLKEAEIAVSDIALGVWTSVDIPLSEYSTDITGITQMLFSSTGVTVFIDNLYFYTETPTAPSSAAEAPTALASTVTSVFSDSYDNITSNEWNPGWGQSTVLTEVEIDGNKTLKYEALNYTGIVLDYDNPTDLSNRTHVHFDYWTSDASSLGLKLVNTTQPDGPLKEAEIAVSSVVIGTWASVDIPLSEYSTDITAITQLLFSSSSATVYIDNLYFYTEIADAPSVAAPTPTIDAASVISVYSDAYDNITSNEWNPGWGQTTVLTEVTLEGNNTLKYEALNYTGIVLDYDNPTNLSSMTYVHFDYWTNDASSLGFKLVNTSQPDGPLKEEEIAVSSITVGVWTSVDIPLSEYSTDITGITQLLFSSSSATVYIDNLYFY